MDFPTALLELLILVGIALATPGPNPITAFAHSGVFGKKSNIGLIAGMAVGILMMELIIGLTIESLKENRTALVALHWIGMAFLAAMALTVFRIHPTALGISESDQRIGFKTGVAMQFANGKEWAFIIIIMSRFIAPFGGGLTAILLIASITISICILAMMVWTFFGDKASNLFTDPVKGPRVFKICGTLLSLLWVAFLLRGPAV